MKRNLSALIVIWTALLSPSCFAGDLLGLKIIKAERGRVIGDNNDTPLNVRLDDQSGRQFAQWTSRHIGEKVDLLIDGRVVMQPRLLSPITGGSLQIRAISRDEVDALIPKLLDGRSVLSVEAND
jgi:preprotein translocase subunit SecD